MPHLTLYELQLEHEKHLYEHLHSYKDAIRAVEEDVRAFHRALCAADDSPEDRLKAMQTLLTADLQDAGVRLGLDAVESELEKMKGTESDAKEHETTRMRIR